MHPWKGGVLHTRCCHFGKFVESGSADDVILHPKAAYTQRLINDVPKIYGEWDLSTV
jgi:peptide/nickel transport system ATP-binding protein